MTKTTSSIGDSNPRPCRVLSCKQRRLSDSSSQIYRIMKMKKFRRIVCAILSFLKCDLQQYFFNVAKEWTRKKQLGFYILAIMLFSLPYVFLSLSYIRCQSYQIVFFFDFQFLMLSFSVCNIWKKCIYYKMAKVNSEKRKYFSFTKKKSLVGLTPGVMNSFFSFFREKSHHTTLL